MSTNPRKKSRFGCREDGRGERRRFPPTGMAVERGTGDEPDGNLMLRAEKRLERAQEETKGEGNGEEEEDAGRWEEGCSGVASL